MFAEKLYEMSIALWRPLPFRLSDAFLTLFLHDLEKPWKYGWTDEDVKTVQSFSDPKDFIFYMAKKYGIQLSEMHINAIQYVHWEGVEYNPDLRIQQPLAAFIHVCDVMSARVYFDYPKKI